MTHSLRLLPGLLLLPLLVACGGGSSAAVGTWKLDGAATLEANRVTLEESIGEVPEGMRDGMKQMAEAMIAGMNMSMTLDADGTATGEATSPSMMSGEATTSKLTGTWTLDGDKISITAKEDGTGEEGTMTGTIDGDTIRLETEDKGQKINLVLTR